jgi:hypothetical protein
MININDRPLSMMAGSLSKLQHINSSSLAGVRGKALLAS